MKFLQTGDWHLGKVFYETSLIDDQKVFLSQIEEEITHAEKSGAPYDALLIPGDIYDRAIPPSEAVTLLSTFLADTHKKFPKLQILIIAGNHDSSARLGFGSELFEFSNIHICSDTKAFTKPILINGVAFYMLPFLTPGSISRSKKDSKSESSSQAELFDSPLRTQTELYKEAIAQIDDSHSKNYKDMPYILCAHAYVLGAENSEEPRATVGTAELVDAKLFSSFTYTALGHIHKFQPIGKNKNAYYSGSPLAYSFDDKGDKFMISVSIDTEKYLKDKNDCVNIQKIQFRPLHPVVALTGTYEDFFSSTDYSKYKESYVSICCTDNTITTNPLSALRAKYPHILSFTRIQKSSGEENSSLAERRKMITEKNTKSKTDVFDLFIKDLYGENFNSEINNSKNIISNELRESERKVFIDLCKELEVQE